MTSTQIMEQLKNSHFSQTIEGVDCTYSILKKSQKTLGFLGNERMLLLRGIQSISYHPVPDKDTQLPYTFFSQMPKAKQA